MHIWIGAVGAIGVVIKNANKLNGAIGAVKGVVRNTKPIAVFARRKGFLKGLWGSEFILVGPPESGKTSFLNLMSEDLYADETPTFKTDDVQKSNDFIAVKVGEQEISVGALIDTPGEHSFETLVENISENDVGNVVIWCGHEDFQSGDKARGLNWLKRFLVHLNGYFLNEEVKAPITSILIVLNKKDLVTAEEKVENENLARQAIQDELGKTLGRNILKIPVVSCTLLKRENGKASAEEVFGKLATRIKSKKPLYDSARKLAAA